MKKGAASGLFAEMDIDIDVSIGNSSTSSLGSEVASDSGGASRDEVKELQKFNRKDNLRVSFFRVLTALLLMTTAVLVTFKTYVSLDAEQYNNFEAAFEQFSGTLADAALLQQLDIRDSLKALSNFYTTMAVQANATWPFFTLPNFEAFAQDTLGHSRTEMLLVANFVEHDKRSAWEQYATNNVESWLIESHEIAYGNLDTYNPDAYHPFISRPTGPGVFTEEVERPFYFPFWSFSPPPISAAAIGLNLDARNPADQRVKSMLALRNETVLSPVMPYTLAGTLFSKELHDQFHSKFDGSSSDFPHVFYMHPVYETLGDYEGNIVSFISTSVGLDVALRDLLPDTVRGLIAVVENTCNQTYTYSIDGKDAFFLGEGDLHDSTYDGVEHVVGLFPHDHPKFTETEGHCMYTMRIYPSAEFQDLYDTNTPERYAVIVGCTFLMVFITFWVYDSFVRSRNSRLLENAAQSNAIVSSLFPDHIRSQLINTGGQKKSQLDHDLTESFRVRDPNKKSEEQGGNRFASLYLNTTVMFADISGFTAWSSAREPYQVFELLEAVYGAFDVLAKRRSIFKVETVGDCYVAVSGLPTPRDDHAVAISRFARDCLAQFAALVRRLETSLGPDTSDLALRIGLHSGPVTAGVLRGERARFQLFGDTVNTAARMESTSLRQKIQVSEETAQLLRDNGRESWLVPRDEMIEAKGKGILQTYWLISTGRTGSVAGSVAGSIAGHSGDRFREGAPRRVKKSINDDRKDRLINWNTETMLKLLKGIVAYREASPPARRLLSKDEPLPSPSASSPFEEVKEVIAFPRFNMKAFRNQADPDTISIDEKVVEQLREYITLIASMYRDNPFHNFEHASHVSMSVVKLLSRIVSAESILENGESENPDHSENTFGQQHVDKDLKYGLAADPLTQFACAFSALVHDVDHEGVPNAQLVKENGPMARHYSGRSVAEQNSLEISWDLLMERQFDNLRALIMPTAREAQRFRELVVNSVMATDIVDKELKTLRNDRWALAFDKSGKPDDSSSIGGVSRHSHDTDGTSRGVDRSTVNRKTTIVIEHLIQASDISHTMQHWQIYRKWNERLFEELYIAFRTGRSDTDPSINWATSEIGFFDFYIIPLAKKLKECSVFGVSSGEFLDYAYKNREEWKKRGPEVVASMLEKYSNLDYTPFMVDGAVGQG